MDIYHPLLDMWLQSLPGTARHEAYMRSYPSPTYALTDEDIDRAVTANLKQRTNPTHLRTIGEATIPAYNRALLDAAELIKIRMKREAVVYTR